ncbi:MAG: hypothetical protein LW630_06400 [Saprospiraceae bacterium]|nr:hypothetical protein [Saprospiraceae bacterium]
MRLWIFIIITAWCASACQSGNNRSQTDHQQIDETPLYLEVMAIHDAVMPEMSTLHNLKKSLKEFRTEANEEEVLYQIARIEKADEAMMSWMAAFQVPENSREAETYLSSQKIKIQAVADSMNIVIRDVEAILQSPEKR